MAGGEESSKKEEVKEHKKVDIYFLGSSDNPGNLITPIQLRGENYEEWARAIQIALRSKRKFAFVEGNVTKPTDSDRLEDWAAVHSMLVSWLLNTIEPALRSTISFYDDDAALWTNLRDRFCVKSGARTQQLKTLIGDCKQSKIESVNLYFGRLNKLWDDLAKHVSVPSCLCGGCKCDLGKQFERLQEEDRMHKFLMGLDTAYASIRSSLLNQDPLPSLRKAYQQVTQEERLQAENLVTVKEAESAMIFKVQQDVRGKAKSNDNADKFCAHCNREGHNESTCFQIHGFPEWWGDRPRGSRGPGRGGSNTSRIGQRGGRGGSNSSSVRANKLSGASSSGQ